MNLAREIMRAALRNSQEIEVPAADWAEACRIAHDGEWIDAQAADCPDSDDAGWHPLVYRCLTGEWRGRMVRS